jgi:putative ABC transport system permease protein
MLWLAARDWIDEWPTSLCLSVGVTAAAVPLLLLLSIRSGVILQMRAELDRFPSSRELASIGQPKVGWETIAALRARPDVAFAAPLTRLLAASAVVHNRASRQSTVVDLLPSERGDPLAPGRKRGEIVISDMVARDLRIGRGDQIHLTVNRTSRTGEKQRDIIRAPVAGVIAADVSGRRLALIDTDVLVATEIYREDSTIANLVQAGSAAGRTRTTRSYSGIRAYARSVDDVEAVRAFLLARNITVQGRIEEIRLVQRLDRGLRIFIGVIAAVGVVGLCLSLAAAQWAWVERRRMDLSYLRLIGFEGGEIALLPVFQSLLIVFAGLAGAAMLGWLADSVVDRLFKGQLAAGEVSRLGPAEFGIVAALASLAAVAASIAASAAARRISPAEALRGA